MRVKRDQVVEEYCWAITQMRGRSCCCLIRFRCAGVWI